MRLSNNRSQNLPKTEALQERGLRPARGEGADAGRVARDPERVRGREGGAVSCAGRPPVCGRVDHCEARVRDGDAWRLWGYWPGYLQREG